jgi:hypothetical protein
VITADEEIGITNEGVEGDCQGVDEWLNFWVGCWTDFVWHILSGLDNVLVLLIEFNISWIVESSLDQEAH